MGLDCLRQNYVGCGDGFGLLGFRTKEALLWFLAVFRRKTMKRKIYVSCNKETFRACCACCVKYELALKLLLRCVCG